jgi:xanthine/CO dehydrogenase XdhC/CoxF family maturation factor
VGLDIGAETAEEIALSLIAEIKAILTGKEGHSLRHKTEPIHKPLPEAQVANNKIQAEFQS